MDTQTLIKQFEAKSPQIVFEWKDTETEAEGWVVINSLRGGAAGGGTRMRKGLDRHEVESLAKTMEVKFSVSGPDIGGAKSGINFDPQDARKAGVLKRWFQAVQPLLKSYYGTGGDLNIDELGEVIPITEEHGLWHPQEGVVNGHCQVVDAGKVKVLGRLRYGVSKTIEDERYTPSLSHQYSIADMVTGFGVAESVKHFYRLWHDEREGELSGKRVIIQGWGNVACGAAFYLSQAGARIVGIIDSAGGLINVDGLSHTETVELIVKRESNKLITDDLLSFNAINQRIWDVEADIFIPAAASRLIQAQHLERMANAGVELIACGANVPFDDREIFLGPIAQGADQHFAVIPDFIANSGMARVFAYLMASHAEVSDQTIFDDVSERIQQALVVLREKNSAKTGITQAALDVALNHILSV